MNLGLHEEKLALGFSLIRGRSYYTTVHQWQLVALATEYKQPKLRSVEAER